MKTIRDRKMLLLEPETRDEREWMATLTHDSILTIRIDDSKTAILDPVAGTSVAQLMREVERLRPINVTSQHADPAIRLIGNFADTPFYMDEMQFETVESFWQGLKFETAKEREQISRLNGRDARRAGEKKQYGTSIYYNEQEIPVGTWRHWELMEKACTCKFEQNPNAREALNSTGERPLQHRVMKDSKTIPGLIMAEIWMRIRSRVG